MNNKNKGFSLVELMVVIAIIAILAAVAVPMYSNYTTRAKIGTALTAIGGVKNDVSERIMNLGTATGVGMDSGSTTLFNGSVVPTSTGTSLAYTTSIANGIITIAITVPVTGNIILTPDYVAGAGSMTWTCSGTGTAGNPMTGAQIPSPCSFT